MKKFKLPRYAISDAHEAVGKVLSNDDVVSATFFERENGKYYRVRATKKLFRKRFYGDVVISIGKPNYREREYLKKHPGYSGFWVSKSVKR